MKVMLLGGPRDGKVIDWPPSTRYELTYQGAYILNPEDIRFAVWERLK